MSDRSVSGIARWSFVVVMAIAMVVFIALGIWQVQRLAEKEALVARIGERLTLEPVPLPAAADWPGLDLSAYDYRPVRARGHYVPAETVFVFTSLSGANGSQSGPGYWVMVPFALDTGGTVFVNRGFIPQARRADFADGGVDAAATTISGLARLPEAAGSFTPGADAANRIEWIRAPQRLAALVDPALAPFAPLTIDLPASTAAPLPQGGETVVSFPNNHLGYAITWFGFAAMVPVLLILWLRRQRRPRA